MNFIPLFDNVSLDMEVEETALKTPDPTYTENATVLAVGKDVSPEILKVGDKIAVFGFAVKNHEKGDQKFHTIRAIPAFIAGKYIE